MSLIDVIGKHMNLTVIDERKAKGLCPFHEQKSPAFYVFKGGGRELFKCFQCGAEGGEHDFLTLLAEGYQYDPAILKPLTMEQLYAKGLAAVIGARECAEYHNQYDGTNYDLSPFDKSIREIREKLEEMRNENSRRRT